MNFHKHKILANTLQICFLFILVSSCADYSLVKDTKVISQSVESDFCLKPPESKIKYSKVMFVLDKSGSNSNTDPNQERRLNAVKEFVSKYKDNPFYKWSVVKFKGDRADSLINEGDKAIFSDSSDDVAKALDKFKAEGDGGTTPYMSALTLTESIIIDDLVDHPDEISTYNIFFVSDGRPTDSSCTTGDCPQILNQIKNIRSKDSSRIFLSTVYYYGSSPDPAAGSGLEKMAKTGGGTYSNAGNGDPVIFKEVKTGERPEPWVIKGNKLIAYNLNSAFCSDSTIGADSDADGICDSDELLYNEKYKDKINELYKGKKFDPYNRNSLHKDYSDSFVWKFDLTVTASGLPKCSDKKDDQDFDLLNSCEERLLKDTASANGPTNDWTEKMKAQDGGATSRYNFDSDGDLFLDFIEFFQFRLESSISAAVDYNSISNLYAGGVTAETIMLEHRHFMQANVHNDDNYDISTFPKGINEKTGEQCYGFKLNPVALYPTTALDESNASNIDQLAHLKNENKVLIYFIATEEDNRHGAGILYHKIQTLNYNSPINIDTTFNIEDFQTYKAPLYVKPSPAH